MALLSPPLIKDLQLKKKGNFTDYLLPLERELWSHQGHGVRTTEVLLTESSFPNNTDDQYLEKGSRRDHSCTSESKERRKPNKSTEPLKTPGGSDICTACPGAPSGARGRSPCGWGRLSWWHLDTFHTATAWPSGRPERDLRPALPCVTATVSRPSSYFPLWPAGGNDRRAREVPYAFAASTEGLTLIAITRWTLHRATARPETQTKRFLRKRACIKSVTWMPQSSIFTALYTLPSFFSVQIQPWYLTATCTNTHQRDQRWEV